MSSLGEGITHFAVDLFQQIRQSKKENIFYSPLSIMSAFAMTSLGARGHTASEIQKVGRSFLYTYQLVLVLCWLLCRWSQTWLSPGVAQEAANLPRTGRLNVANRLYAEKTILFLQAYVDNVEKFYLAGVEPADFVSAAEESRKTINSWVESQTNSSGSVDRSTALVLLNAVYFKGKWHKEFKKEDTGEGQFWLNKVLSINYVYNITCYTFSVKFKYLDMQVKILEIPYKGQELSMFLLLPNDVDGLQQLEDQLTAEKLIEWTSPQNMNQREIELHLPQFKVEETYDLKPMLRALGMVDAFTEGKADFSGMSKVRELKVSEAFHKSFVEVNEEGTEATAVTGVEAVIRSAVFPESFHCDHPFLFLIKHNKINSLLFYGRVSSPEM
uniref:Serpin B3-like n=1 Tax=Monodon monoceros TaxID=40151 RepID=A0A8C6ATZ1_MONMO